MTESDVAGGVKTDFNRHVRGRRPLWWETLNFVQGAAQISVRTPAIKIDIFLF